MRLKELDSLRGLAALSVIFSHLFGLFNDGSHLNSGAARLANYSPMHALWGGHEAVILFFVLSGFVLSIPWTDGRDTSYICFSVKRVCRIWIPYLFAFVFAIAIRHVLFSGTVPGMSRFFYATWAGSMDSKTFINLFSLIGYADSHIVNGVAWSLCHEIRISLVFPLLMIAIAGLSRRFVIVAAVAISLASGVGHTLVKPRFDQDIFSTIHYAMFFLVGYLLARHRTQLAALKGPTFSSGVCLYTYSWWFFPGRLAVHAMRIDDWVIAAGASLLIASTLGGGRFSAILNHSTCRWLGDRSYSIYLYHLPVMVGFVYVGQLHPLLWAIASIPATLLISDVSYRLVELPAIALGRKLTALPGGYRHTLPGVGTDAGIKI